MSELHRNEPLLSLSMAAVPCAMLVTISLAWLRAKDGVRYRTALETSALDVLIVAFFVMALILTLGPASTPAWRRLDLIPFRELQRGGFNHRSVASEMGGNILLFVPLGFLVALRWPSMRSLRRIVVFGSLFSFTLETLQLAINAGREASVTDITLNTLGSALGYSLLLGVLAHARRRYGYRAGG